jgi:DNA-binding NarL/FixJ family response regulator
MSDTVSNAVTVLIADDHPIFRRGLREVVEETGRFRVVAEAADGPAAMAAVAEHAPQIAILDLSMPGADGFAVAAWMAQHAPDVRRVVMTMHRDKALAERAQAMGILGYILKDDAFDEVARCLEAALAGEGFVSPGLDEAEPIRHPSADADIDKLLARLTPTQHEVLRHLAEYATNKEIARRMGLSHRTVENHRANIAALLGLKGPNRVLEFAVRLKDRL